MQSDVRFAPKRAHLCHGIARLFAECSSRQMRKCVLGEDHRTCACCYVPAVSSVPAFSLGISTSLHQQPAHEAEHRCCGCTMLPGSLWGQQRRAAPALLCLPGRHTLCVCSLSLLLLQQQLLWRRRVHPACLHLSCQGAQPATTVACCSMQSPFFLLSVG